MKRILLFVGPFAVALAAALFLLDGAGKGRPETADPGTTTPPPVAGPTTEELASAEPTAEPTAERPSLAQPVRVLVLADQVRSFTTWCLRSWRHTREIEWQAWHAGGVPEGYESQAEGMPALAAAPGDVELDAAQVLVVAGLDPKRMPAEFWARVAGRVRDGRLGLLVVPDHLTGKALAEEPSLRAVLPVASVLPMAPLEKGGKLIPGVFRAPQPFAVTADGTRHPASRLVSYPGWSQKLWARFTTGPTPWTTSFVSPVEKLAPGATTLVEVVSAEARWPAIIASGASSGRALWVAGLLDLDWDVWRKGAGTDHLEAMSVSWIAWLATPRS